MQASLVASIPVASAGPLVTSVPPNDDVSEAAALLPVEASRFKAPDAAPPEAAGPKKPEAIIATFSRKATGEMLGMRLGSCGQASAIFVAAVFDDEDSPPSPGTTRARPRGDRSGRVTT